MSDGPQEDTFPGGGEMGALMRATDWSKTKLGPVESWPRSLRTMLGVVLGSRFPMLLWWGPDLLHLYNDAYRPILRDKHPESLAAPASEIWAEVWDVAGPMARGVQAGGPATWTEDLQLFVKSGTMAEETYFTFSYSPVPGDDGQVGGILNTVQETTAKVQSDREIRMLHDLAARAAEAKTEEQAFRIAADVLATNELDLPFSLLYVLDDAGEHLRLVGVSGWSGYEGPAKPSVASAREPDGSASWPFAEVMRTNRHVLVDDLSTRFGALPLGSWNTRPERALVFPLLRSGQSKPYASLIAGLSPHRAFDERYQSFFSTTAGQVSTVVANARAYEAERKRAELDRAKTTFFSNVSHEFRTPLTLMLGPLEDALADRSAPLGSAQEARLKLAHDSALRLLKLVNALLDFSRLEAGRLRAQYVPTDLSASTAKLAGMFESACEKAGLRLSIDCPPLSAPIWVDRDMWEKIVPNLISNASKFTFAGGISVRMSETDRAAVLEVADTGAGIPEADLPLIFDRFHRVAGATGRTHEGTGIGLSLVRELVELHGGSVTVESVVDRGSTFRVEIPKGSAHLPPAAVTDQTADLHSARDAATLAIEASRWAPDTITSGTERDQPPADVAPPSSEPRARVLVVDDNADLRSYVAGLLAPSFSVTTAPDGRAALNQMRTELPDIIVSDVMMPNLDGFGLVRELRADPKTASLPVILLSARAGEEAAVEGLGAGSDNYLAKPFSARELLARVRTHVELARIRREWSAKLEAANAELEAFSYSVSHDLRAPLRHVMGFAQLLDEAVHNGNMEQVGARTRTIVEAAAKMSQLIDDLLTFARLALAPLTKRRLSLEGLVEEVRNELMSLPDATGRQVEWRIERMPPIDADSPLMRQVLVNLISNALKYSARRAPARVEIGSVDGSSNEVVFFVRDNGVGFDARYSDKLFGVFQRLHGSDDFEGTGIGLANVKRIVSRHGGRVWAESVVDQGATFFVALPKQP